jgi:preprotein translocase subunit SecF
MSNHRSIALLIGLGIVTLIIGAGLFTHGAFLIWRGGMEPRHWPTAQGRIESSEQFVQARTGPVDVDVNSTLHVKYKYSVAENSFTGDHVLREGDVSIGIGREAQEMKAEYAAGALVQVYYNPANPSDAVLRPGTGSAMSYSILFAVICSALAIALLVALQKVVKFAARAVCSR